MKNLLSTVSTFLFLLNFSLVFAQPAADSCVGLLQRLEDFGKKQSLAEMYPLAVKAQTACRNEFGEISKNYAEVLSYFGFIMQNSGKNPEAIGFYKRAIDIYQALKLPIVEKEYGVFQSNLAQCYILVGDIESARVHNDSALFISEKLDGERSLTYGNRLVNKGYIFFKQSPSNLDSAEYFLRNGIEILETLKDSSHYIVMSLNKLSSVLREKGSMQEAINAARKSSQRAISVFGIGHPNTAFLQGHLAAIIFENGGYFEAETLLENAIIKVEGTPYVAHPFYLHMLINLAASKSFLGKYDEARKVYEKTSKFPISPNPLDSAEYFSTHGFVPFRTGNEAEAIDFFKKSLRLFEKLGRVNSRNFVGVLGSLGALYYELGDLEQSVFYHEKAIEISDSLFVEPTLFYANLVLNASNVYFDLGKRDKANELLNRAFQIAQNSKTETQELAAIYLLMAQSKFKTGEFEQTRKFINESLRTWEKVALPQHLKYCETLIAIAKLEIKTGNPKKAEELHRRALQQLEKGNNQRTEEYQYGLAEFAKFQASRSGKKTEALALLEQSQARLHDRIAANFTFLSENGKERFLKKHSADFEQPLAFAHRNFKKMPHCTRLAFDSELAAKGMVLNSVQAVAASIRASGDSVLTQKFQTWKTTRQLLARQLSLPADERLVKKPVLDSLARLADEQEADLNRQSIAFRAARAAVNWQTVRDSLATDAVAIEFVRFRPDGSPADSSVFYAALVQRRSDSSPVFVLLFEEKKLASLLHEAEGSQLLRERMDITFGSEKPSEKSISEIYRLVWQPLEPLLAGAKTVWIAPVGLLHRVGFAAISPTAGSAPLLERFDLRLVGSTREVVFQRPLAGRDIHTGLLVGGIEYDADSICLTKEAVRLDSIAPLLPLDFLAKRGGCENGKIAPLPGTKTETDLLAAALQPRLHVRLVQGCAAREDLLKWYGNPLRSKAPSPNLLHIATHGFYCQNAVGSGLPDLPLFRTGLLVAGAQRVRSGNPPFRGMDDGVLYAEEIANLDFTGTKLAVLSACETALGDLREGNEGVYGLARAFRLAGAEHVMMSLWQISDAETVLFMETLYRHWQPEVDLRVAFLKTQRELRAAGKGREIWAAFVLI